MRGVIHKLGVIQELDVLKETQESLKRELRNVARTIELTAPKVPPAKPSITTFVLP